MVIKKIISMIGFLGRGHPEVTESKAVFRYGLDSGGFNKIFEWHLYSLILLL